MCKFNYFLHHLKFLPLSILKASILKLSILKAVFFIFYLREAPFSLAVFLIDVNIYAERGRHPRIKLKKTVPKFRTVLKDFLRSLVHCDDLFFIVGPACLADPVRHHKRSAFAALYKCRSRHFPVCSLAVASCLGMFVFRTD